VLVRRLSVTAAIVVLGALVFVPGAQACSCAPASTADAMRQADAAIVGKLVEVVPRGRRRADYRYWVQRVYKRGHGIRRGRTIAVSSARQSAACALPRRTGRRYGLFLLRGEDRWTSGLCGVVRPGALDSTATRLYNCAS
jgi:TPR repeat protein